MTKHANDNDELKIVSVFSMHGFASSRELKYIRVKLNEDQVK